MSSRIVQVLMGASLALSGVGFTPTLLAHAADATMLSDTITFGGTTSALTCLENCGGAANLPNQGGNGSFVFAAPGTAAPWNTCTVLSDVADGDSGSANDPGPSNCNINSSGFYENLACGNGEADGTVNVTSGDDPGTSTFDYDIDFVAGQGTVTGTGHESDSAAGQVDSIAGTVTLSPTGTPSGSNCTPGFNVLGSTTVTDNNNVADADGTCDPGDGGESVPDSGSDSCDGTTDTAAGDN